MVCTTEPRVTTVTYRPVAYLEKSCSEDKREWHDILILDGNKTLFQKF